MKQEILNAIKLAEEIAEKKGKLVVGTGRNRVPQDSEGNPTGAPIMIHFDASKNLVFFRVSNEEGDPWGFEFPLDVAEALTWALNDLLGIFDECQAGKIEALEVDLATTAGAANYFAEEKNRLEKALEFKSGEVYFLQTQIAANQEQIDELLRLRLRVEELEHFAASVSWLYATDRPDLVDQSLLNDVVLFKIEPPEAKK